MQEVLEGDGAKINEGNGVGCIHEDKLEVFGVSAASEEAKSHFGTLLLLAFFVDVDGL